MFKEKYMHYIYDVRQTQTPAVESITVQRWRADCFI